MEITPKYMFRTTLRTLHFCSILAGLDTAPDFLKSKQAELLSSIDEKYYYIMVTKQKFI